MNKLEQYQKQVSENEDTAIKLLRENIQLKNEIEILKSMVDDRDNEIDEYKYTIKQLEEKIKDIEQDRNDNYKPIPIAEQIGISDKDFC